MVKVKNFWQNSKDIFLRRQSGILSAALVIALTYGISMILGIFRERLLVSRFFSCCRENLDVYYAAFRLPDMIFQLVVIGALSAAFIPVFSEKLAKNVKEANELASSFINLLLGFFLILAVAIFIAAKPISILITGNFTLSQIDLMTQMTRLMLLAQIFFLLSNFLSAMIQSHQRFLLPALSPIVYNLGIIASVFFLSKPLGIWSASVGVLIGAFFHLIIQIPLAIKLGFRYRLVLNWADAGVRKMVRLMLPRTMALAASQVEATVSLFLATSLSTGSLTLYYLAQRLADLPVRLVGTSIGQAALPLLSLQLAEQKNEDFKKTLVQSLSQILYLSLPLTAVFLVLRVPFVRFAYGARSFPWEATITTGKTLAAITLSIFPQCAIQLLIRGFYALHDTTIPFFASVVSVIISIVLSLFFIFSLNLGIFGLALAFSISNLINFLLLIFLFHFKKEKFIGRGELLSWFKMAFASVIVALVTWGSMRLLDIFVFDTSRAFPLLLLTVISSLVGILVYFGLSKLFKLKELKTIVGISRKISQWPKSLLPVKEIIEPPLNTPSGV